MIRPMWRTINSSFMFSDCCDENVMLSDDFIMDGQWIRCIKCEKTLSFVRNEDLEIMEKGELPQEKNWDTASSVLAHLTDMFEEFVKNCRVATEHAGELFRTFSIEPEPIQDITGLDKKATDRLKHLPDISIYLEGEWVPMPGVSHVEVTWQDPILGNRTEMSNNIWMPKGMLEAAKEETRETPQDDES